MAPIRGVRQSSETGVPNGYRGGLSLTPPPLIRWGHGGDGEGDTVPPIPRLLLISARLSASRARGAGVGAGLSWSEAPPI